MTRPIDAVPAESSAGHRAGRLCPCGPVAMRDLATGAVSIWRHRTPQRVRSDVPLSQSNRQKLVRPAMTATLPPITEREFQRQVLDLAGILGWTVYHPALSKWSERGWPDLAMVRPPRFVLAELKRETGKVSDHQTRWLGLLRACPGIETYLWRPSDLDHIAEVLR